MSESVANAPFVGEGGQGNTICGTKNHVTGEIAETKKGSEKHITQSGAVDVDECKGNSAPINEEVAKPTSITSAGKSQSSNQATKSLVRLPIKDGGHSETAPPALPYSPLCAPTVNVANGQLDGPSTAKAISFKIKEEIYIVLPENQQSSKKTLHLQTKLPISLSSRQIVAKPPPICQSGDRLSAFVAANSSRPPVDRLDPVLRTTFKSVASTAGFSRKPNPFQSQAYITPKPAESVFPGMPESSGTVRQNVSNGRHGTILPAPSTTSAPVSRPCRGESTDQIISMRDGNLCLVKLSLALQVDKRFYVERYEENPKHKDLMITVVTASRHHPSFGCSQDAIGAKVTYDDRGHMAVIETSYIRSGLFQVIPMSRRLPHPIFTDASVQEARFVSRSTLDKTNMPPLSQYVIMGDILQVPTAVRKSADPMTNRLVKFLYSPKFEKFTLPILIGHGEPNVWSKLTGAPQVKPVYLAGKLDYNRWKWVKKVTIPEPKKISRKCDPTTLVEIDKIPDNEPVCHFIYGNCVDGAVCPEVRAILMRKHRAKCNGCLDCLTPEDRKVKPVVKLEKEEDMDESGSHSRENIKYENVGGKSKVLVRRRKASRTNLGDAVKAISPISTTSCTPQKVAPTVAETLKLERVPDISDQRQSCTKQDDIATESCTSSTARGFVFTVSGELGVEKGARHSNGQKLSCSRAPDVTESLEYTCCDKHRNVVSKVTNNLKPGRVTNSSSEKKEASCTKTAGIQGCSHDVDVIVHEESHLEKNRNACRRLDAFCTETTATGESKKSISDVSPNSTIRREPKHVRKTKTHFTKRKASRMKKTPDTYASSKPTPGISHQHSTVSEGTQFLRESKMVVPKQKICCAKSVDTSRAVAATSCTPCTMSTEFNFCSREEMRDVTTQGGRPKRSRKNKATCDCPDCKSRTPSSQKKTS